MSATTAKARRNLRAGLIPPWSKGEVRTEYADGFWAYAVGAPAETHREYAAAVKIAQRDGWNPWWIRNVQDVDATLQGFAVDEAKGRRAVEVIEAGMKQTIGKWAKKPFLLFDWQKYDLIIPLFGWVDKEGVRRFRKSINWTPKKNGKSNLAAAIGLYMLVADGEHAPEIYCSATSRAQAGIIHKVARDIVKASPPLQRRLTTYETGARIVCRANNGIFQALSAESKSSEGLNWHLWLCDEVHVNSRALVEALAKGGIARNQSLAFIISTAGIFDPHSIGWEYWELSQQIHQGSLRDVSVHTLIYAADPKDDWRDPAVLRKANPSLGLVVPEEVLRKEVQESIALPSKINTTKRYNFNVWVQSSEVWLRYDKWARAGHKTPKPCYMHEGELFLSPYAEALRGRLCYGGFDLSTTTDMTAAALWFPPSIDDPAHRQITMYWVPAENIVDLGLAAKAPYGQWVDEGWLHKTDGDVVDYQAMRAFFVEARDLFDIRDIGYDRFNATSIVSDMISDGFEMVKHPQSYAGMSPPIKEIESLLGNRQMFVHENHPVLNWNIGNTQTKTTDSGDKRVVKSMKQRRYHIDGVCANLTALWRHLNSPDDGISIYETMGTKEKAA